MSARYQVIGHKEEPVGIYTRTIRVCENAKTKEEANILFDLMLEDESMVQGVTVIDLANGKKLRDSMDENEQPL